MGRKSAETVVAAPPTLRTQVVGNVGLYFAAYRLSQMGWNVMPTSRNARGVDILAYDMSARRFRGIQVKTLQSKSDNVRLGDSLDKLMGEWWVIVVKAATDKPECFIMKLDEVRKLAQCAKRAVGLQKKRKLLYWLAPNKYDKFREAWHRIGRGDTSH